MQRQHVAALPPEPPSPTMTMTDAKEWEDSPTNPAAMPLTSPTSSSTSSAPAHAAAAVLDAGTAINAESELSTSLGKLDLSKTSSSSTKPLHQSLYQNLPNSPPAPAPPPKDKPLPTPEDVVSRAETAHSRTTSALPALPHTENGRLHPGFSKSSHTRSMSGSSILDAEDEESQDTKGEIRSIMSQFSPKLQPQSDTQDEEHDSINNNKVESPSAEKPPLSPIPPRTSSLGNLMAVDRANSDSNRSPISEKPLPTPQLNRRFSTTLDPHPHSPADSTHPPPVPDPEPPQPFDFHRFLEQLRHRTADPVARFLRSFLNEFGKRQWLVHEQVKIISDFLDFIHGKMAICDVWREVSDAEFDNAKEGMEKLVMNRLYTQTFSPTIQPPAQSHLNKRGKGRQNPNMPGRRGQHQEDVERDDILAQKVAIYGWVREEHLDIKPVGDSGRKFLSLACQELLKINNYRAPRDKVICVLNCCKVIFGLLRHANSTQSADDFVPLLIYVVLRANPEHLVSNIQYILRFRNPDKLGGEAGYYLSSLSGAIQFIEGLDRSSLTINDEEFERNVEEAVRRIAEIKEPISPVVGMNKGVSGTIDSAMVQQRSLSLSAAVTGGPSTTGASDERGNTERRKSMDARPDGNNTSGGGVEDEKAAVAGLLSTLQKPLSTIGRIFGDGSSHAQLQPMTTDGGPVNTPLPGNTPRTSPGPHETSEGQKSSNGQPSAKYLQQKAALEAAESAARQASAETAEAVRIQRAEHENTVGILASMFPDLDKDIIDDVVRLKEGRVGLAVDACLALSS
ncbi:hypothetical protein TWF694_003550 [Orbilia ellipsospora]|uniref:Guanine nucleotide exchange factor Vps9 n=1 Tax=Orbilia ellipsospora TaxID=2528407 RepID=A0AAV9WZV0_9PEZI